MRFKFVFSVLLMFSAGDLFGQTLVPADSSSTSVANGHAFVPADFDPMDPNSVENFGNGSEQRNTNATGSAATAGGSDGNQHGTASIALTTEGFALPNQVIAAASLIGQVWSHDGEAIVSDHVSPPMVNDPVLSGVDLDGDGIDDAIDASVIVGGVVLIDLPDVNGNGIDDAHDDLLAALGPGMAGGQEATADTNTDGVYIFDRPEPPAGFVWVASGSYSIAIGGPSVATATVTNPAMSATVSNMTGEAIASAVDVLAGVTKNTFAFGAEGIAGSWSIVVDVGPDNPFPMTADVEVSAGEHVTGGILVNLGASATANIEIENVILVDASTLPPMNIVNEGENGGGDGGGDGGDGYGGDGYGGDGYGGDGYGGGGYGG